MKNINNVDNSLNKEFNIAFLTSQQIFKTQFDKKIKNIMDQIKIKHKHDKEINLIKAIAPFFNQTENVEKYVDLLTIFKTINKNQKTKNQKTKKINLKLLILIILVIKINS